MIIDIAICDDDIKVTSSIENILYKIVEEMNIYLNIDIFYDGSTLVSHCKNSGKKYDLIYLDIEMKAMNGILAAKEIRKVDNGVILIFISNYDSYLKELLEIEPFRFLDKPVDEKNFKNYFLKALQKMNDINDSFSFKYQKEFYRIKYRDIIYFESRKRIINVITKDEDYQFYGKLNDIEKMISEKHTGFLRIHQSYLINLQYVKRMAYSYIELDNGEVLSISDERQKKVRDTYCRILGEV